jgi:hypothetical protein
MMFRRFRGRSGIADTIVEVDHVCAISVWRMGKNLTWRMEVSRLWSSRIHAFHPDGSYNVVLFEYQ